MDSNRRGRDDHTRVRGIKFQRGGLASGAARPAAAPRSQTQPKRSVRFSASGAVSVRWQPVSWVAALHCFRRTRNLREPLSPRPRKKFVGESCEMMC